MNYVATGKHQKDTRLYKQSILNNMLKNKLATLG